MSIPEFVEPVDVLADPLAGLPAAARPALPQTVTHASGQTHHPNQSSSVVEMLPERHRGPVLVVPASVREMQTKYQKMHTQNELRRQMLRLVDGNVDNVHEWLQQVAKDSPAAAIDRFIELLKFGLPQLKEATLNVTRDGQTKTYRSSEEILQELNQSETPP